MGLDPTNNGATNMINLTIKHWDLTNKLLGIWARKKWMVYSYWIWLHFILKVVVRGWQVAETPPSKSQ